MMQAIGFYEQALVIAKETGDCRGEGSALNNLGIAWATLGATENAVNFYDQALTIIRETGDRRAEGSALNNLALVLYSTNCHARAIKQAEHALSIFQAIDSPNAEMVRQTLAQWRALASKTE